MKKKLVFLMVLSAMVVSLCACGADVTAEKDSGGNIEIAPVNPSVTTEVVEETKEDTVVKEETEAKKEEVEVTEPVVEEEPKPVYWIDEHNIYPVNGGTAEFATQLKSDDRKTNLGEVMIPFTLSLEETQEGAPEGYKKVICHMSEDGTNPNNNIIGDYITAFDAYTGLSFECNGSNVMSYKGEKIIQEDSIVVEYEGNVYDITKTLDVDNQWPIVNYTLTIVCPVEYDGTVFMIGGTSVETSTAMSEIDFSARAYTVDELPYYSFYYFGLPMNRDM